MVWTKARRNSRRLSAVKGDKQQEKDNQRQIAEAAEKSAAAAAAAAAGGKGTEETLVGPKEEKSAKELEDALGLGAKKDRPPTAGRRGGSVEPAVKVTVEPESKTEKSPESTKLEAFFDLQCPFSKTSWVVFKDMLKLYGGKISCKLHLTSLPFHRNSYAAQTLAVGIRKQQGDEAFTEFVDMCFAMQESFLNEKTAELKFAEVANILAGLGVDALQGGKPVPVEADLAKIITDFEIQKEALAEIHFAHNRGVKSTPAFCINEKLHASADSTWTLDQWKKELKLDQTK